MSAEPEALWLEDGSVVKPEFHVTDQKTAEWVLGKLLALESRKAAAKAQAAVILRQIESDEAALHARFDAELQSWATQEIQRRGGRRKSVATLQGTLKFTTVPARLAITDESLATEAAITLNIVSTKPDLAAYRKRAEDALEATGEILPGCALTEERESFSIKFPKDKDESNGS